MFVQVILSDLSYITHSETVVLSVKSNLLAEQSKDKSISDSSDSDSKFPKTNLSKTKV